jgi:hypothetical protein
LSNSAKIFCNLYDFIGLFWRVFTTIIIKIPFLQINFVPQDNILQKLSLPLDEHNLWLITPVKIWFLEHIFDTVASLF